jgi:hypothetical protein
MPKMQTACPNCQQPIMADVTQVFDVGEDPGAKEKLLSGMFNIASCPSCGYQGQLPVPIVYHDPEKELLLTHTPPSVGSSMEERENALAPLLKQVIENLPQEERKGYLFQPETMLTVKSMVERVLEGEGVTKEMLEAQEKKVDLIRRLVGASEEAQSEIIEQEKDLIDEEFFALFSRVAQTILLGGNTEGVEHLQALQDKLLDETEYGQRVKREAEELEAARESLTNLGNNLTRDKLLDLVVEAPNEDRVRGLTSLARPAMDYTFFQKYTDRIEAAEGERRQKLVKRRNLILKQVEEIDKRVEERMQLARQNLETLLKAQDLETAIRENLSAIDDFFIQALSEALQEAKDQEQTERLQKLEQILAMIEQFSAPPEMDLIDELLTVAPDSDALQEKIDTLDDQTSAQLIETMTNLVGQLESNLENLEGEQKERQQEIYQRLKTVYKAVLRDSMGKKFKQE